MDGIAAVSSTSAIAGDKTDQADHRTTAAASLACRDW
jgi:hypothetical protein